VIGLDTGDHTARARVRVRDGGVQVVNCAVEPAPPHRIRATTTVALIPPYLTPRLPTDFTEYPELAGRGAGARMIVFSGLPGAGKSTMAEATGRQLRVPVFAVDWLLEGRERGIPGWHEGGNWANVERRLAQFPTWTGEVLTIDAVQPLAQNLATVLEYVTD
jgi:hypothetical protein